MDDDLNIAAAMASVFQNIRRINKLLQEKRMNTDDARKVVDAFQQVDNVLNIFQFDAPVDDDEITRLRAQRREARQAGNWALADKLRQQLHERGVMVCDAKISRHDEKQ